MLLAFVALEMVNLRFPSNFHQHAWSAQSSTASELKIAVRAATLLGCAIQLPTASNASPAAGSMPSAVPFELVEHGLLPIDVRIPRELEHRAAAAKHAWASALERAAFLGCALKVAIGVKHQRATRKSSIALACETVKYFLLPLANLPRALTRRLSLPLDSRRMPPRGVVNIGARCRRKAEISARCTHSCEICTPQDQETHQKSASRPAPPAKSAQSD
jgi:hypothetical protein